MRRRIARPLTAAWLIAALAGLAILAPGGLAGAAGAMAPQGRYLFDIVGLPHYKTSWKRLVAKVPRDANWVKRLAGPSSPSKAVDADGRPYELANVCKAHDCGDNRFFVLFSADGTSAVGALVRPSGTQYFGRPSKAEKKALLSDR